MLILTLELLVLASVGFVVARTALGQLDNRTALAYGLVIGPVLFGLTVNTVWHALPGMGGAIASWLLILALGAGLVRRAPHALTIPPRTVVGFTAATLAVFWIALASRQALSIPDVDVHLGPAAYIHAGGWPPIAPWNPGQPLIYHYGTDLLTGILTPPFGPDLPFTTEILSAYIWSSFFLVIFTALMRPPPGTRYRLWLWHHSY